MKISRRGSNADHGPSSIELNPSAFSWDKLNAALTIRSRYVSDFSTNSKHDYTVTIGIDEINQIVHALSEAAISEPNYFEKTMESSIKDMLRILIVLSGVKG